MNTIPQTHRYLPHKLETKYHSVKLYRTGVGIKFVCRRYKISKASLMRWNKRFDGTKESLVDKSHRPLSKHPNEHTEHELTLIKNYMRRTPSMSMCELYGKLRKNNSYSRHPGSLYRVFVRLGYRQQFKSTKKVRKPQPYDTPTQIGVKWQMDVKFVPKACYVGKIPERFYQYTVIDEASRQRFIFPYKEHSSYSTNDFVKRAIKYFGYTPEMIQTDNGSEFTHIKKTNRIHLFDALCSELNITHKLIRPRTPQHNGKVERSHRNDQERFYNHLSFYSYDDLISQMKLYLKRSNHIPMQVLNWLSPIEMRNRIESAHA